MSNIWTDDLRLYADVEYEKSLSLMTTLRIGGTARYVIYPKDEAAVGIVADTLKKENIEFKVIGKGSNLLCSDDYFDGAVIRLDRYMTKSRFEGTNVIAQAGCSIISLAYEAMQHSLTGLEFASGIPATAGGVVYMDAGAYKKSMNDIVEQVQVYRNHHLEWISREECEFCYRTSIFQHHPDWIVTAVALRLEAGSREEIKELMENRRQRRLQSQPLNLPSAGSVFRNPDEIPAWKLIEGIGYRGRKVGAAQVSEKHVNFIVNTGGATSADFMSLAEEIQAAVLEKYHILLKMEVEKFNWK